MFTVWRKQWKENFRLYHAQLWVSSPVHRLSGIHIWSLSIQATQFHDTWPHHSTMNLIRGPIIYAMDLGHIHMKYTKCVWERNQIHLNSTSELWKNVKNSGTVFKLSDNLAIMKFCNGMYIAWCVCGRISEVLARNVAMMQGSCGFGILFFKEATPLRRASRNCRPSNLSLTFL